VFDFPKQQSVSPSADLDGSHEAAMAAMAEAGVALTRTAALG
jgi:hypothetical protein